VGPLSGPQSPQSTPAPPTQPSVDYGYYPVDAVSGVLQANCGSCHGPDAPLAGSGGIRFIDDVGRLIEAGLIIPLTSVESPLIRVIVLGSMPPPSSGLPLLAESDINTLVSFIDNPRYWPDVLPSSTVDAGTAPPPIDAGVDGG
jgi:hypothetical protein